MPGRIIGVSVDAHGNTALPHGAADARAAHPPREGDVEHLHRAGAARQHGRDVRRLSRPRGPDGDRRAACTATATLLERELDGARLSRSATPPSSTRCASTCRRRRRRSAGSAQAAEAARHQLPLPRRRHDRHRARRDDRRRATSRRSSRRFAVGRPAERPSRCRRPSTGAGDRARCPAALRAHVGVPDAPGLQHASLRDAR